MLKNNFKSLYLHYKGIVYVSYEEQKPNSNRNENQERSNHGILSTSENTR